MTDPHDDTVAAAQRRLLEAVANLGSAHALGDQNYVAAHFARGLVAQAERVEADATLDRRAGVVFCELARLVSVVHRERLALEAAAGGGLDG